MILRFYNLLTFYKSTFTVNIAVSLIAFINGGLIGFCLTFAFLGFVSSLIFKEIYRKNEYLFYYNNGITKFKLIVFSFIFNLIFTTFFYLFLNQIISLF
jgi:hypothetical protein